MTWQLSSSSDRRALDVVDGSGAFAGAGPHYSRRPPGSRTFIGCGQEVVLVSSCGRAVWACVRQKTPTVKGRTTPAARPFVFRNMLFRNLGAGLSSDLIRAAVEATLAAWADRYGSPPAERLRTEVDVRAVRSTNPGCCYLKAGWERGDVRRGKLILWAPARKGE